MITGFLKRKKFIWFIVRVLEIEMAHTYIRHEASIRTPFTDEPLHEFSTDINMSTLICLFFRIQTTADTERRNSTKTEMTAVRLRLRMRKVAEQIIRLGTPLRLHFHFTLYIYSRLTYYSLVMRQQGLPVRVKIEILRILGL